MKNLKFLMACLLVSALTFSCNKDKVITDFTGSTFTTQAGGCGTFFVYRFNVDEELAITVRGERDALNLSTDEQIFDLENTAGLDVAVLQFNKAASDSYCNDVIINGAPQIINSWEGINGTVSIQITEDSIYFSEYELIYKVSIKVEEVEFIDSDGNTQEVDAVEFSNVNVGWLPG